MPQIRGELRVTGLPNATGGGQVEGVRWVGASSEGEHSGGSSGTPQSPQCSEPKNTNETPTTALKPEDSWWFLLGMPPHVSHCWKLQRPSTSSLLCGMRKG